MIQRELNELSTQLLRRVSAREEGAEDEFYELVYDVLHGLARRQMVGQPADHTLHPTALVHEAWLRMSAGEGLSTSDERLARVVELRFFGGLTSSEAAQVLEVSPSRAERDWRLACVFLRSTLSGEKAG